MNPIIALDDLVADLPFSVVGRPNLRQDLRRLFLALTDSIFVKGNDKVTLLSYSFATLKKAETWETDTFAQDFFFYSRNDRFSLAFLNAYYGIRVNFTDAHTSNNVALLLSELFVHDLGFRVRYIDDGDDWQFGYVWALNTFSIKIPVSWLIKGRDPRSKFKQEFGKFIKSAMGVLSNPENISKLLVTNKKESERGTFDKNTPEKGYSATNDQLNELTEKFIETIFDENKRRGKKEEMVRGILQWHQSNPGYLTSETERSASDDGSEEVPKIRRLAKEWVDLLFQISFISLVYDSWVEYFPATCGIQESHNEGSDHEGTTPQKLYRNLGAVIVGYDFNGEGLTDDERSAFKLISSRINVAVAGDFIYKMNRQLQIDALRRHFASVCRELISDTPLDDGSNITEYLHGRQRNPKAHEFLRTRLDHKDAFGTQLIEWHANQPDRFSKYLTVLYRPGDGVNHAWNAGNGGHKDHYFSYGTSTPLSCGNNTPRV